MQIGRLQQESDAYRTARDALLKEEIALRDQIERVASMRRELPLDTHVDNYAFVEGPQDLTKDEPLATVHLQDLVSDNGRALVLYQFMFGGAQENPCPGCTMWCDGFAAVAPHIEQNIDFAFVAEEPLAKFRSFARERSWNDIRLLSSAGTSFKRDFGFGTEDGGQLPGISVFVKDAHGEVRHAYSQTALIGETKSRGIDLLSPVWNMLDYTPAGRPDWFPKLSYN